MSTLVSNATTVFREQRGFVRALHETPGWPDFTWDHSEIESIVADVRYRQGRLLGRMEHLSQAFRAEAQLMMLTEHIAKSSVLDGEPLEAAEVRPLLAQKLGFTEPHAVTGEKSALASRVDMFLDASQNWATLLTAERLLRWQGALFPGGRCGPTKIDLGQWRSKKTVGITESSALAAARIPGEMRAFLNWFNALSTMDPVIKAALAHYWFVSVQPFQAGNESMALAIVDLALASMEKSGERFYSLAPQFASSRKECDFALNICRHRALDVTPWLEWFLGCLGTALDAAEISLGSLLLKARTISRISMSPINERQRKVLTRLVGDFRENINTARYCTIVRCSKDTALADINGLLELGLLIRQIEGRRTFYRLE